MTPSRAHLGKAVARGSWKSTVLETLKDKNGLKYCLKKIGVMIRNEIKRLCSQAVNSILSSQSVSDMNDFTWDKLHCELAANAPVLHTILQESTITETPRPNRKAVVGMCASLLLKHRCCKMSLVQKIMSLILYSGHSGKQVLIFNHQLL